MQHAAKKYVKHKPKHLKGMLEGRGGVKGVPPF